MTDAPKHYIESPKVDDGVIVSSSTDREMAFAFSNLEIEQTGFSDFFDFDAYYAEPSSEEQKESTAEVAGWTVTLQVRLK